MKKNSPVLTVSTLCAATCIQTVSAQELFWADLTLGAIQYVDLTGCGTPEVLIRGLVQPRGVAVDAAGGLLYWSARSRADDGTVLGTINRANLDGTDIELIVELPLLEPSALALDLGNGKIYWTTARSRRLIQRCNLDGTEVEEVISMGWDSSPQGIALDIAGGKIYWADALNANSIRRANLDGTGIEDLVTQDTFDILAPSGLALDLKAGKLYWTDIDGIDGWRGRVCRADLDGTNPEILVRADQRKYLTLSSIVLDLYEGKMYWDTTSFSGVHGANGLWRADLDGSAVTLLIDGLETPIGMALVHDKTITTSLDIKPGSCPSKLNVRSRGVTPMAVVGTAELDVTWIDVESLALTRANGVGGAVYPVRTRSGKVGSVRDISGPGADESCGCHEPGRDGIDDLVLRFSTREMVRVLELHTIPRGTDLSLTLTGSLLDGPQISATGCTITTGPGRIRARLGGK